MKTRRDSQVGLKIATVAGLVAIAGAGLSFYFDRLGWVIGVIGALAASVGIAVHWITMFRVSESEE